MKRTIAPFALLAVVLLAACSSNEEGTRPPTADGVASTPALPKCAEVFKLGQKIDQDKAKGGCLDPGGGVQLVGAHRCNDGRYLWQVDASTGAPAGWGFGNDVFVASKDAASDPAYSKAYEKCKSPRTE